MLRASAFTAVGLSFLVLPILSRAANAPIRIPDEPRLHRQTGQRGGGTLHIEMKTEGKYRRRRANTKVRSAMTFRNKEHGLHSPQL